MSALPPALQALIMGGAVLGALVGILAYVTLLERKFAARLQSRIGPYRVGPHGLLQPIADGVKLMLKENLIPDAADRTIFNLAPVVFLVPCLLIFATIPFAPGIGVADLDTGVLFFLAISTLEPGRMCGRIARLENDAPRHFMRYGLLLPSATR